ncbi:MAG TPA: TRZ/ATZ family hydrolase [Burkholderiales bacterium]|nr:TRZ/ATZ family hydrolase [Burkholderiales bacterium]
MERADTVIDAQWIVPVDPPGAVLEKHSIAIRDSDIVTIGPSAEIARRYDSAERIVLDEHVLIPGLVNLHTHAAMALMRGLADDRALMDWLRNHIWPAEAQLVSPAFVRDGTLLACAEMLRSGITCFSDMYFFPEAAAEAALAAGMRAAIGMIVIEMPSPYAGDARDYLAKGLAMRDALRDEPLLSFCIAPHAPYTVSDPTFERIATYAAELDLPVHIHVHETDDEVKESVAAHGMRPLARLQRFGLLGPGLIAVHAVHVQQSEIELLAQYGCSVAHCPSSNLKLASGIAPIPAMLKSGINVGIGTDGAASNNRLDLMSEMRTAALLAKGSSGDPTVLPAHTALHMATVAGAKALGIDQHTGSLVPGKRADVVAVRLSDLELTPLYDPVSHLVYAAGREHVTHVWVNGKLRVDDGALTSIDARELHLKAAHWRERIGTRDGGLAIE